MTIFVASIASNCSSTTKQYSIPSKVIYARMDVKNLLYNHLTKALYKTKMCKYLKKRCERCDELFDIPNIRRSVARDAIIQFYACTHCGYSKTGEIFGQHAGRCKSCSIPFAIIHHHGKGMCNRCYKKHYYVTE